MEKGNPQQKGTDRRPERPDKLQASCSNAQGKLRQCLSPIPHNPARAPNVRELHKLLEAILCLFAAI